MNYGKLTEDSGLLVSDALYSSADIVCDIGVCGNEDFSHHLMTCWNEYDTLKAKAELLDEAIHRLELVLGFLNHCKEDLSHRGETQLHRDWITETLTKAKELK